MKFRWKLTTSFLIITTLLFPLATFASPLYFPGEELNPSCAPGATDCTVYPMSIGAGVASGTAGSVPFIDNDGVFQQDNANLKWDEDLKRLTVSQGLEIGTLGIVNTVTVGTSPTTPLISGDVAYVVNTSGGTMSVVDMSNPGDPTVSATLTVGTTPRAPLESGNYLYVSNGGSGTVSVIYKGATPAAAAVQATVTVGTTPQQGVISGNYLYIPNTGASTISVIDITTPASAAVVKTITLTSSTSSLLTVSGNYLYAMSQAANEFYVIDITTPASAAIVNTISVTAPVYYYINSGYGYILGNSGTTTSIIDLTSPASATVLASFSSLSTVMLFSGSYAYSILQGNSTGQVRAIDISNPASPSVITTINLSGSSNRQAIIVGDYMYVALRLSQKISIIDISTPSTPVEIGTVTVGSSPIYIVNSGDYLFVSNTSSGTISIIDISDPENADLVETVTVGTSPGLPVISGSLAYITNISSGTMSVFSVASIAPILPASSVVALSIDGTIQSTILSGTGAMQLSSDTAGNIIPSFSDAILKTDTSDIMGAMDKIRNLQGKYFYWKDTARFGTQREIGFIAQEVEGQVPEVVRQVGSYRALNYGNLVALQNEGLKELDLRIATIESLAGINEAEATQTLFARFGQFLSSATKKVLGGIVQLTGELITPKATIDALVLKDRVTNDPYCVFIEDGKVIAEAGDCIPEPVVEEEVVEEEPTPEPEPVVEEEVVEEEPTPEPEPVVEEEVVEEEPTPEPEPVVEEDVVENLGATIFSKSIFNISHFLKKRFASILSLLL